MPTFSADTLVRLSADLFEGAGMPPADANVVAHSLVDANLCGHDSHGVMRVPQYLGFIKTGVYKVGVPLAVVNETPAVVVADGGLGLGQVQAHRLLAILLPKARALGIAAGTLRNCGHVGRLGEYAEAAAREQMAFFGTVNSHGSGRRVSPPGGTEGRISTNPICLGTPTSTEPVILDFGTSAAAEGKVRVVLQKKERTPDGWLIDNLGRPSNDPNVLYANPGGSLVPFGGPQMYKGFGLGLLLDLLSGGLSGGPCSSPAHPIPGQGNAGVFIVFNPALFGGVEHFLRETDGLTGFVRTCPVAEGCPPITMPGDPERLSKLKRQVDGIPLPDGTWEVIAQSAAELNVKLPAA